MELINIDKIKINPNNPRFIRDSNFKNLVQSVKQFPQMLKLRPIVVNKEMIILGGNMRYRACKEIGTIKEIPVIIAKDLTPEQEDEFLIKDNVSGGEWDWDILANQWDREKLSEWGVENWEGSIEDMNDIEEVNEFSESMNFTVKCESIEQFEELQTKLNIETNKIGYKDFLIKVGL